MKGGKKIKEKGFSISGAILLLFAVWLGVKLGLIFMLWVTAVN
tara:strand:+ start:78 stop:206 length:129 start_codon:yes stop_codon:yes gene_type:complete